MNFLPSLNFRRLLRVVGGKNDSWLSSEIQATSYRYVQKLAGMSPCRLDYQPLFGKMSPHSSPERLFGEDHRPDPGDGGNRA